MKREQKIKLLNELSNGNRAAIDQLLPPILLTYFVKDGMYHVECEPGQYDTLSPDEFQALKARHKNRMLFETQKSYL